MELTTEVGGREVRGVDTMTWDDGCLICDLTVMVRPMKGWQAVVDAVGAGLRTRLG